MHRQMDALLIRSVLLQFDMREIDKGLLEFCNLKVNIVSTRHQNFYY